MINAMTAPAENCRLPRDGDFMEVRHILSAKKESTMDGRSLWRGAVAAGITLALGIGNASASFLVPQTALPGKNVPKYRDPLPTFAGSRVPATSGYTVSFEEFKQQVLPASGGFGPTTVWGYKINGNGPLWPGYTVEATKGSPATATYVNNLAGPGGTPPLLQKYLTVDQTIHWADPFKLRCMFTPMAAGCFDPYTGPVPAVAHLHGGEDKSDFDGGPEQWFTPNGMRGPAYRTYTSAGAPPAPANGAVYNYPNGQEATTLWFHDHALGTTRLNVYGGLAASTSFGTTAIPAERITRSAFPPATRRPRSSSRTGSSTPPANSSSPTASRPG